MLICIGSVSESKAQEGVTTFGIQLRPIIPSEIFNSGFAAFQDDEWNIDIGPKVGLNFGMVIRQGLSKMWSLETGINFATRNYFVDASFRDDEFTIKDFKLISYEIPVKGLVYIRMSDQWYVNAALGLSLNMFPSNIRTRDDYFENFSVRKNWVQSGVIGNVGFEFRTKEKGYFYIGGTLNRPFTPISITRLRHTSTPTVKDSWDGEAFLDLTGNYFTIDLRYFFHEDPEKKTKKKKK